MIIILDALIPKPVSDCTVGLPKLPLIFLEEFMRLGRVIEETAPHVLDKVGGPGEKANALLMLDTALITGKGVLTSHRKQLESNPHYENAEHPVEAHLLQSPYSFHTGHGRA